MHRLIIALLASALMAGCASRVPTSGTAGAGKYSEDLSVWRPDVVDTAKTTAPTTTAPERIKTPRYVEAVYADNQEVDTILDSIYTENKARGFVDGYTIQVYSGIKREDALNVKKKLTQTLPELESEVQYRQPNFRVRLGQYYTRLSAQKDYLAVKKHFPNAIVIPDRIAME